MIILTDAPEPREHPVGLPAWYARETLQRLKEGLACTREYVALYGPDGRLVSSPLGRSQTIRVRLPRRYT